ncbi:MAG: hypothetical protein E6J88_17040 [Deltaproteobacteria bacterium]|nr:MAG: hypothetical protein E6J88_17040 [Deltaproteobacteria bacterium]
MKTIALVLLLALGACGGGGKNWCPGVICSNCATDPACHTTCPAGKTEACVGGAYFDADPDLRCDFCQ